MNHRSIKRRATHVRKNNRDRHFQLKTNLGVDKEKGISEVQVHLGRGGYSYFEAEANEGHVLVGQIARPLITTFSKMVEIDTTADGQADTIGIGVDTTGFLSVCAMLFGLCLMTFVLCRGRKGRQGRNDYRHQWGRAG